MSVVYVGRLSLTVLILENMRGFTLERNHIRVICVGKPSVKVTTLGDMR